MSTAPYLNLKKFTGTSSVALATAALIASSCVWVYSANAQQTTTPPTPTSTTQPAATLFTPDGQVLTDVPDQIILTAIPPRLGDNGELKAKPGEKIQALVRIRNSSDRELPISSLVHDFIIGEDGKTPIQVANNVSNRWSLASWVTLSPSLQTVKPRETAQISVLISVPDDALPGGHYAMILHEPNQNTTSRGAGSVNDPQSVISQRVGSLLYFTVEGPINEEAFVRNLQVPKLTEYGPVPVKFTVENVSDIHIKPNITVEISNMLGRKVDTVILDQMNVFPYVSRDFQSQWDRVWGFGRYTAKVNMNYGSEGRVAMATASFWLIPYKLVLALGVGLSALATMVLVTRRHLIHRRRDERSKIEALEKRLAEVEGANPQNPPTPTDFET